MRPNPFSCVVIGGESLLQVCTDVLRERGHTVAGVVSASPVLAAWAAEEGLPFDRSPEQMAQRVGPGGVDYVLSITNLSVLSADVLGAARCAAINFHDGPLPEYAGMHCPVWGLLHGERRWAVTWHVMTDQVDRGGVIVQRAFDVAPDETSFTLNTKCYENGLASFGDLVRHLEAGSWSAREHPAAAFRYFARYRRPPAGCVIQWDQPAEEVFRLVRALDFGPYPNPVGAAKVLTRDGIYLVRRGSPVRAAGGEPGTVLPAPGGVVRVATTGGALDLHDLETPEGERVSARDFLARAALRPGDRLPCLDDAAAAAVGALYEDAARSEAFWVRRLTTLAPGVLPGLASAEGTGATESIPASWALAAPADTASALAALAVLVARLGDQWAFDVALSTPQTRRLAADSHGVLAASVPTHLAVSPDVTLARARELAAEELTRVADRGTYVRDAMARYPDAKNAWARGDRLRIGVAIGEAAGSPVTGCAVTLQVPDAAPPSWHVDTGAADADSVRRLDRRFALLLERLPADPAVRVGDVDLLSVAERQRVLVDWNDTRTSYARDVRVHDRIAQQAAATPDAPAVTDPTRTLSYRELEAHSNRLAHRLVALGVGPDVRVGVSLDRSVDLVVAVLGVLKAGGAYVPLDPAYPRERLTFMATDADLRALVTRNGMDGGLAGSDMPVVDLLRDAPTLAKEPASPPAVSGGSGNLAYVIYTSGSTGRPKGVMVEHGNLANFFAAMDARVPVGPSAVWLAVTSLSFDISVLELLWPLTHGNLVVVAPDDAARGRRNGGRRSAPALSLFYFASSEGGAADDRYRLLLEGARFADERGFHAVWTPERHFHAFGGLYPNPSVAGAAVAAITRRVGIRAGSVVLPLHHPVRVAEEWAVVDNLSKGRVGISVASGWQPNDFVLAPEQYAERKQRMFEQIDAVRRLWRGEAVTFPGPAGDPVEVRTLPRPIQPELPVWVTTAGNPDTYRAAARAGAFVLTHLLGQTPDDVAKMIAVYREAWAEAGHAGHGHVTLMLHTFVGRDDEVRELVREPMKAYLRSSVSLIRNFAGSWAAYRRGAGKPIEASGDEFDRLAPEDLESLLDFAFERYYETSGLLGSPERCRELVAALAEAGVDEIACLIDFGVPTDRVLAQLEDLDALRRSLATDAPEESTPSVGALMRRHGVTHLQCTPSLARMLLADPDARGALADLDVMLVGGEALPAPLADELKATVRGPVLNMYGPTETTVWSSVWEVNGGTGMVPIGRPIANTRFYALDQRGRLVPPGVPGELYIGGDGVTRGYLGRPELTAERYVPDPMAAGNGKVYRTGDLVRYHEDGTYEFLGRADHQVKIRGHRIELGEIEAVLSEHPHVRGVVVHPWQLGEGDPILVAYVTTNGAAPLDADILRAHAAARLPDVMLPARAVVLERLPLTPNGKVDRRALPAPAATDAAAARSHEAPATALEKLVAGIWEAVLGVQRVGRSDYFFDLGGNSLTTIQVALRIRDAIGVELPLRTIFQTPTVAGLAAHLERRLLDGADAQDVLGALADLESGGS